MAPIFCHARNRCEGWNPMQLSRRTFLRSVGLGTVAATSVQWPLPAWAPAAAFEPARNKGTGGAVRLDNNEKVYGPPHNAAAAIPAALGSSNGYPFTHYDVLIERRPLGPKLNAE